MKRVKTSGQGRPTADSQFLTPAKPTARSRVTNGSALLPTVDGRSIWARLMRDTYAALVLHCGGPDYITETLRATCRRAAALEAELIHLEDNFARAHSEGDDPDISSLDLYGRLADRQRRLHEVLGWERKARDVTPPTVSDYASQFEEQEA